jgi:polyisoprenoid-binding protein YceI
MSIEQAPSITTTRWRIDPARSSVEFQVKNFWGMTTVKGAFARYHGTLDLAADPAIDLTIESDSLDTKHGRRDKHLRSADFFDVEHHPYIRFVSERALLDGERLKVRGRLHARGSSIPLVLEASVRPAGDGLELEAETAADRRELGMTLNWLGAIGRASRLIVKARLVRDI